MSKEEVQFRMAAALSGVPVWYLESGNWRKNPEMVEKVRATWSQIKDKTYKRKVIVNSMTLFEVINIIIYAFIYNRMKKNFK